MKVIKRFTLFRRGELHLPLFGIEGEGRQYKILKAGTQNGIDVHVWVLDDGFRAGNIFYNHNVPACFKPRELTVYSTEDNRDYIMEYFEYLDSVILADEKVVHVFYEKEK